LLRRLSQEIPRQGLGEGLSLCGAKRQKIRVLLNRGKKKMAVTIRGKGVISGIAVGKIMLAGQNLDGYLVNYQPGSVDEEKNKAEGALTAVADILSESVERMQKNEDQK
jgi:hypothetical protein